MSGIIRTISRRAKRANRAGGSSSGKGRFSSQRVRFNRETMATEPLDPFEWGPTKRDPRTTRRRNRLANRIARASRKANR